MNRNSEKKECCQTDKRQIHSMLRGLFIGSLIILAVGVLAYLVLFALMLML